MLPNKQGFRCVPSIGSFTSQACDFKSRSVASVKAVWATITFGCKKDIATWPSIWQSVFFTLTKARAFLFKCSTSSIWSSLQGPKFHGDVLCTCQNVSTQDNHQILSSNGCVWIVVIHRRGEICFTASSGIFMHFPSRIEPWPLLPKRCSLDDTILSTAPGNRCYIVIYIYIQKGGWGGVKACTL